jgi:hypothetical protein
MARHHLRLKEPHWRTGLLINATGALLSLVVDIIIAITKFKPKGAVLGAWVVIVFVPVTVYALTRLHNEYESEAAELDEDVKRAAHAPVLPRHVVVILVDQLDRATASAIQCARALTPDELRAVHIAADPHHAEELSVAWRRLELAELPLTVVDCPDRRVARAALAAVASEAADGQTEVTVLIPRRIYRRFWRLLHGRTAEEIAGTVSRLPHVNVSFVPYRLGRRGSARQRRRASVET